MIAVIATLYVRPDEIEVFEQTFVRLAQAVRENEAGNHLYQPTRVQGETGVYKVMELYDDADAIVAHRASDHFKEYSALLAPMFSGPADIIRMDVL